MFAVLCPGKRQYVREELLTKYPIEYPKVFYIGLGLFEIEWSKVFQQLCGEH